MLYKVFNAKNAYITTFVSCYALDWSCGDYQSHSPKGGKHGMDHPRLDGGSPPTPCAVNP